MTEFAPVMESWGGANDKVWHRPVKAVSFIVETPVATAHLDDIRVLVQP